MKENDPAKPPAHLQFAVEKLGPAEAEEGGSEEIGSGTDQEIANPGDDRA